MFIFKNPEDDWKISRVINILCGLALIGEQIALAGLLLIISTITAIIYDL